MVEMIDALKIAYWDYNIQGLPIVLVLVALGYLLVRREKEGNRGLTIYGIVVWALLMIPGMVNLLMRFRMDSGEAWSVYGIGGAWVLVTYVVAEFWSAQPKGKSRFFALVLTCFLFQAATGFSFGKNFLEPISNPGKVSRETVEVADAIGELPCVVLLAPESIAEEIREYDSQITAYYGGEFMYTPSAPEHLMIEACTYGCNVVAVEKMHATEEAMACFANEGYSPYYESENYVICVSQSF